MKTTNNTVLIIGGSAGIGLEIAKLFADTNNHVIITGRNKQRLAEAAALLKNVTTIVSDFSEEKDAEALVATIKNDFPEVNILVNNAASARLYSLVDEDATVYENATLEMHTNFLSVTRLTEKLLPVLKQHSESAIVNVSSIVALVPGSLAGYSASKAALHSYTQSLRFELQQEYPSIKVFELMPPLVNTEFSKPIGGEKGVSPAFVAEELLKSIVQDIYEIHVGNTKDIYDLLRVSPEKAFEAMHPVRKQVILN